MACCSQDWGHGGMRHMRGFPSVNILLMTKLLSHNPLSWDMDCLLTLWPLLIPCSLDKGCCMFGCLIFIIVKRNSLYNSLYILTERSLKHFCSIKAWGPVSFFLSFSPSLSIYLTHSLTLSLSIMSYNHFIHSIFITTQIQFSVCILSNSITGNAGHDQLIKLTSNIVTCSLSLYHVLQSLHLFNFHHDPEPV